MIATVIHQIWIGDKPYPTEFHEFSNRWMNLYPDFKYIKWTDELISQDNLIPDSFLHLYSDPEFPIAFKADLARYLILRRYGGIYVDADMEPLRRLDSSILQSDFIGGIQPNGEVAIGIIGSNEDNPLLNKTCDSIVEHISNTIDRGCKKTQLQKLSGPEFFNEMCIPFRNRENYYFLDSKYCYPYWMNEIQRRFENFADTCPDAYCVHHWAHSWKV
jgi:mannosyltransferase OCH1-like enzyme